MDRMLRFFAYDHLSRADLQAVSRRFHDLAHELVDLVPEGPERTVALRKLLESKDCAVRAIAVPEITDRPPPRPEPFSRDPQREMDALRDQVPGAAPPRPEPSSPIRKG